MNDEMKAIAEKAWNNGGMALTQRVMFEIQSCAKEHKMTNSMVISAVMAALMYQADKDEKFKAMFSSICRQMVERCKK